MGKRASETHFKQHELLEYTLLYKASNECIVAFSVDNCFACASLCQEEWDLPVSPLRAQSAFVHLSRLWSDLLGTRRQQPPAILSYVVRSPPSGGLPALRAPGEYQEAGGVDPGSRHDLRTLLSRDSDRELETKV